MAYTRYSYAVVRKNHRLGQYGAESHYSTLPFWQLCALKDSNERDHNSERQQQEKERRGEFLEPLSLRNATKTSDKRFKNKSGLTHKQVCAVLKILKAVLNTLLNVKNNNGVGSAIRH